MEQNKSRLRFLSQFHTFIHAAFFKFIHSVAGFKTLSFLVIIPTCITSRLSTFISYTKLDRIIVPDIRISEEHKKILIQFHFCKFLSRLNSALWQQWLLCFTTPYLHQLRKMVGVFEPTATRC